MSGDCGHHWMFAPEMPDGERHEVCANCGCVRVYSLRELCEELGLPMPEADDAE